jgi:hypothetical protein
MIKKYCKKCKLEQPSYMERCDKCNHDILVTVKKHPSGVIERTWTENGIFSSNLSNK